MRTLIHRLQGILHSSKGRRRQSEFEDFTGIWAEAQATVGGYGAPEILDRVLEASLAVYEGRALHERDSVNFDRIDYSWPVLVGLLWSATRNAGSLRVIDLGGSLGTSYRQNRKFLAGLTDVSWAVVEQPTFVAAGRDHFEDDALTFHETIAAASTTRPRVGLVSGSLQYLEDPHGALADLTASGLAMLIVDRTPVHSGADDRLTLQHVPPSIYPATYPAWLLSRSKLLEALSDLGWTVVEEFETLERPMVTRAGFPFSWTGMICTRSRGADDAG